MLPDDQNSLLLRYIEARWGADSCRMVAPPHGRD